jgi:hypothetical protein
MEAMFIALMGRKFSGILKPPLHACKMRVLTPEEMAARGLEGRG